MHFEQSSSLLDFIDHHQISIYILTMIIGGVSAFVLPRELLGAYSVSGALALLLLVTFIQVPIKLVVEGLKSGKFIGALLFGNFFLVPLLLFVAVIIIFHYNLLTTSHDETNFPNEVLLFPVVCILLAPCVDYVVIFCRMAKGDAARLTSTLPILLIIQLIILLFFFAFNRSHLKFVQLTGTSFSSIFIEFFSIVCVPLLIAWDLQALSYRNASYKKSVIFLKNAAVPVTALTLLIVSFFAVGTIAHEFSLINLSHQSIMKDTDLIIGSLNVESNFFHYPLMTFFSQLICLVILYSIYASVAPFLGVLSAKLFKLNHAQTIAVIFSVSTRNSLVLLPILLLLHIPSQAGMLTAFILTQTCVELVAQMVYVKYLPKLIKS
ncbi:hypothetical protein [Bartonella tamiae]|uniref:hypothetical protein n=1 Tax=Bartonella tamiae TaxID=373638 RepID=UPI0002EC8EC4|nr:hypothetical protein [Bartonella tamiae]